MSRNKFEKFPELGKIRHICWERDSQWCKFLQLNKEYEARQGIPELSETTEEARKKLNSTLMKWGELSNFLDKWQSYTETILEIQMDNIYHSITEDTDCKTDISFIQDWANAVLKVHEMYKSKEKKATNDNSK